MAFVLCVYFKIIKMKKIFLLLIVFFAFCFVNCGSIVLCQEADWKKAEELYAAKQYVEAAEVYADMFQYGESAALYYNYANALYKSNQLGLAILNYERALDDRTGCCGIQQVSSLVPETRSADYC